MKRPALELLPAPVPLLTAREVAVWLGLDLEIVRKLARRGILPSVKLPTGTVRFRREDVEAVIESSRRAQPVGGAK